jgi:hypothetical protein
MLRRSSPCRRWRNGKAAPAKSSPPARLPEQGVTEPRLSPE